MYNKEAIKGEYNELSQEVIDTFFKKSVRGTEQKEKSKRQKSVFFLTLGLLISTLALLSIIIILYNKWPLDYRKGIATHKINYSEDIIKNGQVNRSNVEDISFDADARQKSSFLNDGIKLVNFGPYGRASLTIRFGKFIDLDKKNILITSRSASGRKKVSLVLKDSKNNFYEYPNIILSPEWNLKHVYFDVTDGFDIKKIKELKIEFGSYTTGNEKNSVIYIKDISLRKAFQ